MTIERIVLAVNAGSSTLKYGLFTHGRTPRTVFRGGADATGPARARALLDALDQHGGGAPVAAIGHRIVHGGPRHHDPQRIDAGLLDDLRALIPFAPNHLPDELSLIDSLLDARPEVPQFVCFDTAFHKDLPDVARRLPIPRAYDDAGVRRYGFHGLSYTFLLDELRRIAGPAAADGRVVLAHLGSGSSLAAVRGGRSIDTSMGFTPMGGVVMSTRTGDLDPGVVTYIARTEGLTADRLEELLSHSAGLLGVSGTSGDMRELLAHEQTDNASALAAAIYCYQIKKTIGAYAAALGGLDTLVFSGGIGEHAAVVRARICDGLAFLDVRLDEAANRANAPVISSPAATATVRVIPTDEELVIARAAYELIKIEDI